MFYAQYPPTGGGGTSGVTSLNGLTGAITLIGTGGITITPSGSTITIDGSGTTGANQHLSNLLSPTAINQDLLPGVTNVINIGSPSKLFASISSVEYDVFTSGGVIGGSIIASGSDLDFSSPNGSVLIAATTGGKNIQLNSPTVLTNATVIKTISDLQADLGTGALRFNNLFLANLVLSSGVGSTITQQAAASTTPYSVKWPNAQGAASTVLENDGAGNLSWAAAGGSGANVFLSNLSSPTAVNQDLIFNTGVGANLQTQDSASGPSQDLQIKSGAATVTGKSGDLNLETGPTVDTSSGAINMFTGAPANPNINSGGFVYQSGDVTGTGQSGSFQAITGSAVDTLSGSLFLSTGSISGAGTSGTTSLETGGVGSTTGSSGQINISTGATVNGASGGILLQPGAPSGTGVRGLIQFEDGSEGTAGYVWTSIDTIGNGHWSPAAATGANTALSNLTTTSINQDLLPDTDITRNLGNGGQNWLNLSVSTISNSGTATAIDVVNRTLIDSANHISVNFANRVLLDTANIFSVDWQNRILQDSTGLANMLDFSTAGQLNASTNRITNVVDPVSAQDAATKNYVDTHFTSNTNNKQLFTLSSGDITNQYIDLAHVAKTNSIDFLVKGAGTQIEGASYDYSVSYTGGAGGNTRITFLNGLATGGISALVAGDVVVAKYQY